MASKFFGLEGMIGGVVGVIVTIGMGIFVLNTFADGVGYNATHAGNSTDAGDAIASGITILADNALPMIGTIVTIVIILVLWSVWKNSQGRA